MKKEIKTESAIRRQKAEELLIRNPSKSGSQLSEAEMQKLIHELKVNQIDLEMKNEEVLLSKNQAELATEKYTELYDFAPSGYFTLSEKGNIIDLNLSGSEMLGKERSHVKNRPFSFFVSNDTRPIFNHFLGNVFKSKIKETCEVNFSNNGSLPMNAHLTGIVTENGEQCLVTVIDIADRKQAEEALRIRETHLRTLVQTIPDLIWLKDADGVYISCNAMFERFFGASEADIIGKTDYDFVDRELADFFRANDRKAMEAGKPTSNEERVTFADDGHRAYLDTIKTPMYDSDGSLIGVLGIGRDLTERKRAEEILRLSEERYRFSLEITGQIGWSTPPDGLVEDMPLWRQYTGQSIEEVKGWKWLDSVHPDDREHTKKIWVNATDQKSKYETEYRIRRADGVYRYFMVRGIPLFNTDGTIKEWTGTCFDITERKHIEEVLRQSEARFRNLINSLPDPVLLVDSQGRIVYCNEIAMKTFDYKIDEMLNRTMEVLIPKHFRKLHVALRNGYISEPKSRPMGEGKELFAQRKDGSEFPAEIMLEPVEINDIQFILAIIRDITERKLAEKELIRAKNKAEESDRLKSAFLANMSHEVRTPLNSIIGFSELLADPYFDEDQKDEFIQHIVSNGRSLLSIISDIMDISKMDSGEITIRKSHINVQKFISGVKEQFAFQADEKKLEFKLIYPEGVEETVIFADVERLRQIFNNLMSNAIKFTINGSIEIGYQPKGEMVEFFVRDTGIGIPAEYHDSIFERFRQVEAGNSRKYGGNGLGLAISKNLVELMGGKIWIDSESGKGSTFYFTLPAYYSKT